MSWPFVSSRRYRRAVEQTEFFKDQYERSVEYAGRCAQELAHFGIQKIASFSTDDLKVLLDLVGEQMLFAPRMLELQEIVRALNKELVARELSIANRNTVISNLLNAIHSEYPNEIPPIFLQAMECCDETA